MSEYLLVVEGLAEGGADVAMFVSESTYHAAMYGCAFGEPVYGYVWCDKHCDWVRCDEAMICQRSLEDILMREAALIEFEQTLPELDEQFETGFFAQVGAWLDAELSYDEIEEELAQQL